jgi:TRAP-type mannitol/chloroaromatic compound transport system substrate-binding protein
MPAAAARRPASGARRKFLLAAAASATAAVAAPRIAVAQSLHWRVQSAWPPRDIFHEFAADYAGKVGALSGGRFKLDMLAAGAVVPPFQMADAVHAGILDGAHGIAALRHAKHKACSLFGTPPSFGWDSHGFLAWFYYGGGEALYKELMNEILRLNVVGFLYFPMPTKPLGWFRKEITSAEDLRGVRYRTMGLVGEVFSALGAAVTFLPSGDMASAIDRGVLDAADSNSPTADVQLGLPDVAQVYMLGGHHQQAEAFELVFNKSKFDALPAELKAILREAAWAASSDQLWRAYARFAKDFDDIRTRGTKVVRTGPAVLAAQLKAWDQVIAALSKERFFAKVIASQKAWAKRTGGYLQANNLDSGALSLAYRHHFG